LAKEAFGATSPLAFDQWHGWTLCFKSVNGDKGLAPKWLNHSYRNLWHFEGEHEWTLYNNYCKLSYSICCFPMRQTDDKFLLSNWGRCGKHAQISCMKKLQRTLWWKKSLGGVGIFMAFWWFVAGPFHGIHHPSFRVFIAEFTRWWATESTMTIYTLWLWLI
jgi:hypothetical protein